MRHEATNKKTSENVRWNAQTKSIWEQNKTFSVYIDTIYKTLISTERIKLTELQQVSSKRVELINSFWST